MPKQYTFKTTRVTEWMENILDGLPPSERSRFIREAISDKINSLNKVIQSDTLSHKETQSITLSNIEQKSNTKAVTDYNAPNFELKESVDENVDLDSKLNDIGKLFD